MASQISQLTGDDWQDWANKLLCCHYGPTEYQTIPDGDRGDAGLEGFTRTEGHAYQAYGCEEPVSRKERFEKQRDKMTQDINKFINNRTTLQRLLGTVKVTRWALLVPHYDSKEIVSHASSKTTEVRGHNLPYVATSFQVCVCEEVSFVEARDRLINVRARTLEVTTTPPTAAQIAAWAAANEEPSAILTEKLRRLPTLHTNTARRDFHNKLLDWYLRGRDVLDALRQHPDVFVKVSKAKSHHETYLAAAIATGSAPQDLLMSSINDLRQTLEKEVRELHVFSSSSLAHEAVADWLLRCPLDFPEQSPNA